MNRRNVVIFSRSAVHECVQYGKLLSRRADRLSDCSISITWDREVRNFAVYQLKWSLKCTILKHILNTEWMLDTRGTSVPTETESIDISDYQSTGGAVYAQNQCTV